MTEDNREFYGVTYSVDDAVEVYVFGEVYEAVVLNYWSNTEGTTYYVLYTHNGTDYVQGISLHDNIRRIPRVGELAELGIEE